MLLRKIFKRLVMNTANYSESKEYWRPPHDPPRNSCSETIEDVEGHLLKYIQANSEKGNPIDVLNKIDTFANENWMMNLGPEKTPIIRAAMKDKMIKNVLEIGGYCGYSALFYAIELSKVEGAKIHSIEISDYYAGIARQIHQHAGLDHMIEVHLGTVEKSEEYIKEKGPYDLIFIDHQKTVYLQDLLLLQKYGVIQKGCTVIGDNMIRPGAPDYWARMKESPDYKSVLYHQYVEYSDVPDAVLISERLC